MNVSILLLWLAGIAIIVDFIIYIFSHKYRKFGGHLIGAMAYVILLADLTYSLYLGECGTSEFRGILSGALVVGAFFIIEYAVNTFRHIRQHEKTLALMLHETALEEELQQLQQDYRKLEEENRKHLSAISLRADEIKKEMELHAIRVMANKEYEETIEMEQEAGDTREAFQLYTLLIRGYGCERGPKFERQLHNVCERICASLDEKDIKALLQVDVEIARNAGEFYDAT